MADAAGRADPVIKAVRQPPWGHYAAAALTAATLLMVGLGALVARGQPYAFDRAIMLAMRESEDIRIPEGPIWLKQAMLDITALGGETVLVVVVLATAGFLALGRRWLTLGLVLGGTISGSLLVGVFKDLVGRARPALIDHLVDVWSASFPSGHAANSATVYLTIALILMQIVERRAVRLYLVVVAALLVGAIGVSRVYLGVHFPSDVIAGWSFGTLWALGWWWIGAWARVRRARAGPVLPSDAAHRPSDRRD
ncbi:MAG: phosphatase PAP2 family protein [Sphingomonas sp.]|nr:phosphatase PAP2 family protein [Sphingomonas sp.]